MSHQSAIAATLAILSIAALVGVFTVQVADAQIQVGPRGVTVLTEGLDFAAGANGVIVQTEVFGLTADRSGLEMGSPDPRLPSIAVNERGVGVLTEVFGLRVDHSGIQLDPR